MLHLLLMVLLALGPDYKVIRKPVNPPNPIKAPYKKINVQHYKINLNLDFANKQVDGYCGIKLLPNGAPIDTVYLDFAGLSTDSVKTEGGTKLYYSHGNSILTIGLDKTYNPADLVSIIVYYHGKPKAGLYFDDTDKSYTMTESEDSRYWFPCNDIPSDKAELGVEQFYRTPDAIILQATGLLVDKSSSGGYSNWHYKSDYPISTYLIAYSAAPFDSLIQQHNGMPVTHYFDANKGAQRKEQLALFPDMITLCERFYGTYPFRTERAGSMEFFIGSYCMEHQTMISYSDWGYREPDVLFHELAHQWWGDMVTCGTWYDTWLNEAWATYSEWLYYVFMQGAPLDTIRPYYREAAFYVEQWDKSILDCFGCESMIYYKGAFVMEMLRQRIDETDSVNESSKFYNAQRSFGREYKYLSAITEDFILSYEKSTGESLRSFIVQWLGGIGHPILDYAFTPTDTGVKIKLDQVQRKSHPKASIFEFPLEIRFWDATHDTLIVINMRSESYSASIGLGFKPDNFTIDPKSKLLAEYKENTGFETSTTRFYKPAPLSVMVYPNPVRDNCHVRIMSPEKLTGKLSVYDITGRKHYETVLPNPYKTSTYVNIPAAKLGAGVYFIKIECANQIISKKILVVK